MRHLRPGGFRDLNDHEELREDPLLMLLAGSADAESPLAGKSSLNRRELAGKSGEEDRYKKVVTLLEAANWSSRKLYEQLYCARGDMENRMKEQYSFAGRVSA